MKRFREGRKEDWPNIVDWGTQRFESGEIKEEERRCTHKTDYLETFDSDGTSFRFTEK